MSFPVFDPIELPPDHVLLDVNTVEPEALRVELQAAALAAWEEETGEHPFDEPREWTDEEGLFAICDKATEKIVGVAIILDVEDA